MLRGALQALVFFGLFYPYSGSAKACTILTTCRGGQVLVGNNEDWFDSNSRIRFVPAAPGAHGRVLFGFRLGGAQGGMNDAGLFIDATAQNRLERHPSANSFKSMLELFRLNLLDRVLRDCGTVREALQVLRESNGPDRIITSAASILLCDQTGDAVVFEGEDVVLPKQRDVLILTNFRNSESGSGPVACVRFNTATRMLAAEEQPTVESVRDVLAATASSTGSRTQYSTVFDLKKKEIYVYHFHNFREVRRFRLPEETEKGDRSLAISSLFPANHEFQEYQRKFDESLEKQRADRSVAAIVAKGTKEFIVNFDTNGDGKLDLDELAPYGCFFREVDVPTIKTFDRDGDGKFDGDELVNLSRAICPPVLLGGKPLP